MIFLFGSPPASTLTSCLPGILYIIILCFLFLFSLHLFPSMVWRAKFPSTVKCFFLSVLVLLIKIIYSLNHVRYFICPKIRVLWIVLWCWVCHPISSCSIILKNQLWQFLFWQCIFRTLSIMGLLLQSGLFAVLLVVLDSC